MLSVDVTLAQRGIKLSLEIPSGQTLAVMGPNGAGKSTLVQLISGLLKPDAGRISLAGTPLYDSVAGANVPVHRRGIGVLAQEPLLFPHLSVRENVEFGPQSSTAGSRIERRRTRGGAYSAGREWLERVDALEFADRKPSQLSGGQAQRVGLARALATDPQLLLLDEPLAALDVDSVPAMRSLLKRELVGKSCVLVTHDILDALILADHLAIIEGGQVVEVGPVADVLAHPQSAFGASLAGLNVIEGPLEGGAVVSTVYGPVAGIVAPPLAESPDVRSALGRVVGTVPFLAAFPPRAVSVFLEAPGGNPRNTFSVVVESLESRGDHVRVRASGLIADVTPQSAAELGIAVGMDLVFLVKATDVRIYPAG